ncbi:MAG: hypothetical protein HKL86_02375 [Acidimicrobiaceae bacterium]|nr:hypothetical protein [Acidimicrobiaceae bacterium]
METELRQVTPTKAFWPSVVLLSVATGIVDAIFSSIRSLWGDEAFTAVVSSLGTRDFFHLVLHERDAVNATYDLVMRPYEAFAGHTTLILRLPSAAFMAIACAGIMLIARKLTNSRAAILTGAFFLLLPLVQGFGSEARSYALSAAVATWSTWLLLGLSSDQGHARTWKWCYGASLVLLGYVFLYAFLIVAAHALFVASHPSSSKRVRSVVRVQSVALLLLLPLAVISWHEHGEISWIPSGLRAMVYNGFGIFITPFWPGMTSTPYPEILAVLAWSIIAIGVFRLALGEGDATMSWTAVRLGVIWAIVPGVIFSMASLVGHYFTLRYLVFCAPAVALLLGVAVDRIGRTSWRTAIIVIFALLVVLADGPLFSVTGKDGWGSAQQVLSSHGATGEFVMPTPQTYGNWLLLDPRVTGLPHEMTLIDFGIGRHWTPTIVVRSWSSQRAPSTGVVWLVSRFGVVSCSDLRTLRRWGFRAWAEFGGKTSPIYEFVSRANHAPTTVRVTCSVP